MKYTLKLSTKNNVHYREIEVSDIYDNEDQTVISAELISVISIAVTPDARLSKPTKSKYWLWDISNSGTAIFKSYDYMDDNGHDTNGNRRFPRETMIRKHENEWVEL